MWHGCTSVIILTAFEVLGADATNITLKRGPMFSYPSPCGFCITFPMSRPAHDSHLLPSSLEVIGTADQSSVRNGNAQANYLILVFNCPGNLTNGVAKGRIR